MDEKKPHWLEVSVSVDGELAEAVAELISRFATNGVVCEQGVEYDAADEVATPTGPVRVYGYLAVHEDLETLKQKLEDGYWHMSQIVPLPALSYRFIEDQDWMQMFKQHYHPINVGEKLLILPAWVEQQDMSRIAIKIDPSMAFGTGTHPTTQLSMMMLEKYVQPGIELFDIGCGSGVLAITAVKLGAEHAVAVDLDPASVTATNENGERNGVLANIEIGRGSVKEIRSYFFSRAKADIVVANILTPILLRLFEDGMGDLVEEGGTLILSGILDKQREQIVSGAAQVGFRLIDEAEMTDWIALVFRR